jgi:hypothetical protein
MQYAAGSLVEYQASSHGGLPVISASSQCTKVFRSVLTNSSQFEAYVNRIGRPRFAINCVGDQFDEQGPGLLPDEWLFADDLERLMMDFFAWEARGIRMEWVTPTVSGKPSPRWRVAGLSDYFNKSASHLNAALLGTLCQAMGADGARKAFLEAVFADAGSYGFIALHADRYDHFIEEWRTNDDKAARPADYRAEKRFGVVSAVGELGVEHASVQYWASIGWASGWLSEAQLREVGLSYDVLIGQTCVINGLGEVEWIGNIPLPDCDL